MMKRILIVGSLAKGALEHSYISAARELGHEVDTFDPAAEQVPFLKGGFIGKKVHAFLPVEQWMRKMNRKLVLKCRERQPDLMLVFTNARVIPGALACIRTILPATKIVWIWPDTPLNLEEHNVVNGRLVDMTATYSSASVPAFQRMDFRNVHWVPLAADPHMHTTHTIPDNFTTDIGFVGGWRPERERAMAAVCEAFPDLRIDIHGPYWQRECKHELVKKRVKSGGLYEQQLAVFFNSTRINVNIIDDTNFPAANMRFFEVPVAGGLQLSSACPEQESIFRHRQEIVFYNDAASIATEISWIMDHPAECASIRTAANTLVRQSQCYKHRLQYILKEIYG